MHLQGISSLLPEATLQTQQQATATMAARRAEVTRNRLRRESAKVRGDESLSDGERVWRGSMAARRGPAPEAR